MTAEAAAPLESPGSSAPPELSELAQATLARLMPHLNRQPDLPGLQRATRQVQRTARRESSRVQTLVEAVAQDPGLSARLIRLSNSAVFAGAGAGRNGSLDRAVRLLGFSSVHQVASGLPLLDRLPDGPAARLVREDFLRALLAAQLARELSRDWRDTDAAHLAATFQNLGRMLVATHLPDDAQALRAAVPRTAWPLAAREQQAAHRRLGWRPAELGLHVARHWGWPEALRATLPADGDWPLHRATTAAQRQAVLARLANEAADLLLYVDPEQWPAGCRHLGAEAGAATGLDAEDLQQALARTRPRLESLAELVGLQRSEHQPWQTADVVIGGAERPDADVSPAEAAPAPAASAAPEASTPPAFTPPPGDPDEQVLHQLSHTLQARRALLWRRQPGSTRLALHRSLGAALPGWVTGSWMIDPARGTDLFSRLCRHGHDSVIHNAHQPSFARHLPPAYKLGVNARSFVVLPLQRNGRAAGLLYLDRDDAEPFTLDGDALRLVRTLRDQAMDALAA